MEAKDLMIGNLIKTKNNFSADNELNNKYCKVQFLGDKYIAAVLIDEPEKRPYGDEESFEEIPLTAEILEKNGFVYNDLPFIQAWEQFGLALYNGGNGYRINCGNNVALIIDSVHELQHALHLCGIEKKIKI